jgi:hypothetical protein
LAEEWLAQTESQKLERRPLPRAASVIVAGAWAIRRDEATVDLATRVGGTRAERTSGRPNDSECAMQGTLASVCTLAVIRDGAEFCLRLLAERR